MQFGAVPLNTKLEGAGNKVLFEEVTSIDPAHVKVLSTSLIVKFTVIGTFCEVSCAVIGLIVG